MPSRNRFLIGLAGGFVGVSAVTVIFSKILPVNASTVGFFFLLVVLATATVSGFAAGSIVSIAATLCYNYFFLPPIGQFTIADPENWVALFTFVLTSLVASHLSGRAQKEAAESKRSQEETERLYALSRAILLTDAARPIGPQAAQSIAQIFDSPAVAILDGKTNALYRGGPTEFDIPGFEERLQEVVRLGSPHNDIWPIALGGKPIGALAMLGTKASDGAVQSILNLVAIALERVRTEETASKAEAARQSEEFKSTLLDAIAHEFKTPLTSIKAAATGLRVLDADLPESQNELVSIIEEECDRLSQLVTEAAKMSELDAGKVTLKRAPAEPANLIEAAKSTFTLNGAERIHVEAPPSVEPVWVDHDLSVLALRQLLDNALKYSDPNSPVLCRAERGGNQVVIRVVDQGPGIPERDRERIFEKFFRRPGVRNRVPGSGLGLHIAREIARMHGGDVWVEPTQTGSEFCLAFPTAERVGTTPTGEPKPEEAVKPVNGATTNP